MFHILTRKAAIHSRDRWICTTRLATPDGSQVWPSNPPLDHRRTSTTLQPEQTPSAKLRMKIPMVSYVSSICVLMLICSTRSKKPCAISKQRRPLPKRCLRDPTFCCLASSSDLASSIHWRIQMNNHVAQVVKENPHATTHFITLIISTIVTALRSFVLPRNWSCIVRPLDPHTSKRRQVSGG